MRQHQTERTGEEYCAFQEVNLDMSVKSFFANNNKSNKLTILKIIDQILCLHSYRRRAETGQRNTGIGSRIWPLGGANFGISRQTTRY
jgi:hypothetical protein